VAGAWISVGIFLAVSIAVVAPTVAKVARRRRRRRHATPYGVATAAPLEPSRTERDVRARSRQAENLSSSVIFSDRES